MEDLMNVASYICNRYRKENQIEIDEMKLQKLLYFSQRESLIQNNKALFNESFHGWKYGPVLKEIHIAYKEHSFYQDVPQDVINRIDSVIDNVLKKYSIKDSWSLSRLTRGELSWKNSRIGIAEYVGSDNPMKLEDIRKDADRIRKRRKMINIISHIQFPKTESCN